MKKLLLSSLFVLGLTSSVMANPAMRAETVQCGPSEKVLAYITKNGFVSTYETNKLKAPITIYVKQTEEEGLTLLSTMDIVNGNENFTCLISVSHIPNKVPTPATSDDDDGD